MLHPPIENFSELVLTMDGSGIIQQIVEPALVLGPLAQALRHKAFLNLLDPDQASSFESHLLKTAFRAGHTAYTDCEITRPDGSRYQLEGMLRHIAPNLVQLDARDVTALRRSSVLRDRALDATTNAFCISSASNHLSSLICRTY